MFFFFILLLIKSHIVLYYYYSATHDSTYKLVQNEYVQMAIWFVIIGYETPNNPLRLKEIWERYELVL